MIRICKEQAPPGFNAINRKWEYVKLEAPGGLRHFNFDGQRAYIMVGEEAHLYVSHDESIREWQIELARIPAVEMSDILCFLSTVMPWNEIKKSVFWQKKLFKLWEHDSLP